MPESWSRIEVEAVVADYVAMLIKELSHEAYNKSEHRRNLSKVLASRSDLSIERKHQNISAVMIKCGYPYVFGYKPLGNYQALLGQVVLERLQADLELSAITKNAVDQPAELPPLSNLLDRLVAPPHLSPTGRGYSRDDEHFERPARIVDYLAREAANAALGRAGEEFAVAYERSRLLASDKPALAERVEHVAATSGDGLGFDIRSFEADGTDRLIEVKTTAFGPLTPFYATRNELNVSIENSPRYRLYRLYRFRDDPHLFTLSGRLDRACRLEATHFSARLE